MSSETDKSEGQKESSRTESISASQALGGVADLISGGLDRLGQDIRDALMSPSNRDHDLIPHNVGVGLGEIGRALFQIGGAIREHTKFLKKESRRQE